ncbi:hypothetical protein Dalk_0646 [Desulfatibacillum aliphaticivorans]|uniref:FlgN family protein n=1 Tax=Desulfatibacillum aliphaticivorans TaxID=218208 RepID=B8FJS3_DESAL|nr:hypothetical protein [Desulfatibacillum aliphaticivorans]ACL02351.1 hypothetical protein Dalk_0646 [Desulfatibacillum aliphaticivorans]
MKHTPNNSRCGKDLAAPSSPDEFCNLTEQKAGLLGKYSEATHEINSALDEEDFSKVPVGIKKRREVIKRVNILDKKIEQAMFVLRMDCLSEKDQERVEESIKHIEEIVSLLIADEQKCLSRVRARYDAAKSGILDMQEKRKMSRGYRFNNGPRAARFVDSQVG